MNARSPLVPAAVASPYLEREARLIALTRALAGLSLVALEEGEARARCYAAAGLEPVAGADDAEACRRSAFYWVRIRPGRRAPPPESPPFAPPPLAPLALELA